LAASQRAAAQRAAVAERSAAKANPIYSDAVPGVGPIRDEDWFVKTWHDRRGKFADQKAQQQNAVVFFGDSITQGWSDDFRGKFKLIPPLVPPRRGEGDERVEKLPRRDSPVLTSEPHGIILI
jgi:hypothetical protein